ncbi:MAG: hypothetical protein HN366_14185 [Deltaproteobacteria bacterium]|jgi:hypothetical protein|nr:hypothetical protein [Deltaproteobacteria bacterium]
MRTSHYSLSNVDFPSKAAWISTHVACSFFPTEEKDFLLFNLYPFEGMVFEKLEIITLSHENPLTKIDPEAIFVFAYFQ